MISNYIICLLNVYLEVLKLKAYYKKNHKSLSLAITFTFLQIYLSTKYYQNNQQKKNIFIKQNIPK